MKVYQVSIRAHDDAHLGFNYFTSRREAEADVKQQTAGDNPNTCEIVALQVQLTKRGMLAALQAYASHPDNG